MRTRAEAGKRRLIAGIAVAAAVWLLAGCSSSDSGLSGADASYDTGGEYAESDAMAEEAMAEGGDGAEAYNAGETPDDNRAVIVTGSMYMTVDDPRAAANEAASVVRHAGGRVDARSETAPSEYDGGQAWLTLRIPSDDLEAVVDDLRDLGTVDEFSTQSSDVTRAVTDLEAQISTLEASTARIQALLLEAGDIEDIIVLENELDNRQAELESLQARERGLSDQVALSTIELSLTTEPVVDVDDSPASFWDGLVSGWEALLGFLSGLLVITGVLLPWAALAGVVGILAWLIVLAVRRRRPRREAADAAEPTAASAEQP
ncbi:DUF4349 domain-containing protein [Demequina sp. NBRC 110055]|uniref:DUF4349 domain-containing protein n=1 Tax=Demequina sp. NBRC 110055 TaxID=1570344 RepID=UPI0013563A3E|nr:DUF4349 domain-containing protein [Demequina sp. NBRC 110055]